jgi:EAL domain-containing protein (putative c-di-GMP-specific phosphodiesterase class I)
MEMQLRQALERSEFALHFQPKLQIESNRMAGAEVLIGWQHPEKGMLASDVFLPIAEEAGLATEVDQWLLRAACAQLGIWSQQGLPPLTLTVNLSPTLVKRGLAWDAVRGAVDRSGVLPQRLMLAFSEAVLMEHAGSSMTLLRELNQMGVRLAIDNFGNGGCSVAYLSRSPLVQLKLDPSLIAGLPQDRASGTAVGAVIAMAAKLDLNVVAAGVDNAAQLDFLRGQHCHEYQGRLSGGALLAEPFAQLLRGSVDAGRCNPNSSPAAN